MNQKITLSDLADALAVKAHISKAGANSFIRDIFDTILAGLNDGESVKVRQLGTFKIAEVSARKGVDVNTGMPIEIAGRQRITFTPDKELAEAVNAPFAGFETVVIGDEDAPVPPETAEPAPAAEQPAPAAEDPQPEAALPPELPATSATPEPPAIPVEEPSASAAEAKVPEPPVVPEPEPAAPPVAAFAEMGGETTEEPAAAEQPDNDVRKPRSNRFWLGFIIGLITGLAIAAAYSLTVYYSQSRPAAAAQTAAAADTVAAAPADTAAVAAPAPVVDDKPLATDTVTRTRYLTTMARHYYGDHNFWVYIYEENKDKIDNPNVITPGTEVVIPQPSKYGIDASNPESVEKAKRLSYEIFSRYE